MAQGILKLSIPHPKQRDQVVPDSTACIELWSDSHKGTTCTSGILILRDYFRVCSSIMQEFSKKLNVKFSSEHRQTCTSLSTSHIQDLNMMYSIQLWGGSSQMLLQLQWRYVNQCSLEITPTVTWVWPLSSGLTSKHRQIPDYPQDLQSNAVLFFLNRFMTFMFLLNIQQKKHTKKWHGLLHVINKSDLNMRCCGTLGAWLCWLTEWP